MAVTLTCRARMGPSDSCPRYGGKMYDARVTNSSVELTCKTKGAERMIRKKLGAGEVFRLKD